MYAVPPNFRAAPDDRSVHICVICAYLSAKHEFRPMPLVLGAPPSFHTATPSFLLPDFPVSAAVSAPVLLWLKESVDGAHTCTRPPCPFSALPCRLASFGQHAVPAVPATCSGACVTPPKQNPGASGAPGPLTTPAPAGPTPPSPCPLWAPLSDLAPRGPPFLPPLRPPPAAPCGRRLLTTPAWRDGTAAAASTACERPP